MLGLIALKFRLRLVGDLPQPFHSADAGDAGGNRMRIVAGGFRLGNLHHFWDTERVARLGVPLEAAEGGKGPEAVSIRLI